MNPLIIATWNLQTDQELTQSKADAFRRAMDEIKADVWVITEPLLSFSPGADYRLAAHSCKAADIEKGTNQKWVADRRWVAIWSKLPARRMEVLREPDRMACIRIEQDNQQDIVIVGTVLPWASDGKWPSEKGKGFRDALDYQAAEWKRLWGNPHTAGFCVAGDFNQSLPYTPHFGLGEDALRQVLGSLHLTCLTGDNADPLRPITGKPTIDHVCIGGGLQAILNPPSKTWNVPCVANSTTAITDHHGAWAKLNSWRIRDIIETAIYVDYLQTTEAFYGTILGFQVIGHEPGHHVFFQVGASSVLLAFLADATLKGDQLPPHGTTGPGHFALGIDVDALDAWRDRLQENGIAIEKEVEWPRGGKSLYLRDPAGNLVELITPDVWGLPSGW